MFSQQGAIGIAIPRKLQEKGTVVTAVRHMKDASTSSESVAPWHEPTLQASLNPYSQKRRPKIAA
jgi:hypothetical protein